MAPKLKQVSNGNIIAAINLKFGAENKKYPVAFMRTDGTGPIITGESPAADGMMVVDYYGEFRGGYNWVHPWIEEFLEKNGLYYEWENPACIIVYNN